MSLALGISANATVFGVVYAVLLDPFPYHEPDTLVMLTGGTGANRGRGLSKPDLHDWLTQSGAFVSGGGYISGLKFTLSDYNGQAVTGACVDHGVFPTLGVRTVAGRSFTSGDETPDGSPSVILDHTLWTALSSRDLNVVGTSIRLNEVPYQIIGVANEGFFFPDTDSRVWVSMPCRVRGMHERGTALLHGVARLRAGVTVQESQRALEDVNRRLRQAYPDTNSRITAGVYRWYYLTVGQFQPALLFLLMSVGCILLIACTNVAHLLLARGVERRLEFAVRVACGASYLAVARQVLLETAVLAAVATVVGVALSAGWLRALMAFELVDIPRLSAARLNTPVVAATLLVAALTIGCAGLLPALRQARFARPGRTLKDAMAGHADSRLATVLAATETAGALTLLFAAAIATATFVSLTRANWGIRPEGLFLLKVQVPASLRNDNNAQAMWIDSVTAAVQAVPGASGAASTNAVPTHWASWKPTLLRVDGEIVTTDWSATTWIVGPGFFSVSGVPILHGREFHTLDGFGAPRRAVLSRSLAGRLFESDPAVGRTLELLEVKTVNGEPPKEFVAATQRGENLASRPELLQPVDGTQWEVIGVVDDIRMFGLEHEPRPSLYLNRSQLPGSLQWRSLGTTSQALFVVRAASADLNLTESLTAVARDAAPRPANVEVVKVEDILSRSVGGRGSNKLIAVVSSAFGVLALTIAVTGVFAVVLHGVALRAKEFAVRMALGASPWAIARLVYGYAGRILTAGIAAGTLTTWSISKLLPASIPLMTAAPFGYYAGSLILVVFTTLLACTPAVRSAMKSSGAALLKS